MTWMQVSKVPNPGGHAARESKWESVAQRLKEQPGDLIIVAAGLRKSEAGSAVQSLKKAGVEAWARSNDLPEGIEKTAVYAKYEPTELSTI